MILVDTSAWLFALKKDFHPVIKERIEQLLVESEIAICGMIALELLGGTRSEKEYFRLNLNIALKTPHKEQGGGRKRL